jgi:hypothetical protein
MLDQPSPQLGALLIGDREIDPFIEERIPERSNEVESLSRSEPKCLLGHGHPASMTHRRMRSIPRFTSSAREASSACTFSPPGSHSKATFEPRLRSSSRSALASFMVGM